MENKIKTDEQSKDRCQHGFALAHIRHCKDCEYLDEIAEKDAEIERLRKDYNDLFRIKKGDSAHFKKEIELISNYLDKESIKNEQLEQKLAVAVKALELAVDQLPEALEEFADEYFATPSSRVEGVINLAREALAQLKEQA